MPLLQVRVLPPAPPLRSDRRVAGNSHGRTNAGRVARVGLHAMGRRLQPRAGGRHGVCSPPRALLDQTHRRRDGRIVCCRERGRSTLADAVLAVGATMGIRSRVPELPGPGARELGLRLLRAELRAVATRQGEIRPGQLLPLPSIALELGPGTSLAARSRGRHPTRFLFTLPSTLVRYARHIFRNATDTYGRFQRSSYPARTAIPG